METFEFKQEQFRLARKVVLEEEFSEIKTVGGASTQVISATELMGVVVVCEYPSFKIIEAKSFILHDPIVHKPGFEAYREMPAIIEAYNLLDCEPDLLLVRGTGINHVRGFGIACHVGLALGKATIGVSDNLTCGSVCDGKIVVRDRVCGVEMKTREYANPLYFSPGHLISLEKMEEILPRLVCYPHKLPEPLHLAHKMAKRKMKGECHA